MENLLNIVEYKYRSYDEIIGVIIKFEEFSIIQIIVGVCIVLIIAGSILYIGPIIKTILDGIKQNNELKKKDLKLKEIKLYRKLEEIIEKEIKEDQKYKIN